MYHVLKLGSKFADAVRALQNGLATLAYYNGPIDGTFGPMTEDAVKRFQSANGLASDGIVGQLTWSQIERKLGPPSQAETQLPSWILDGFRGNTLWVHEWEGHKGHPYWPGGNSGVTIDPGVDVGQMSDKLVSLFTDIYDSYLTVDEIDLLLSTRGVRGVAADDLLYGPEGGALRAIKISRAEAAEIFPFVLDPYWDQLKIRFDTLTDAPGPVQTAVLSLGYNRGPGNPGLDPLREPLARQNYEKVGNLLMSMQQDHRLDGIRRRRRAEGRLILESL
jgi:peptidoglycan hydrolase-like protein with peptidoglycan-binding domain